jgi:hypothetical protein
MPTHYREQVMDALYAALAEIGSGSGGPWNATAAVQVERVEQIANASPTLPIIYIAGKDEIYEQRASESTWNLYWRTMSVRLLYFVEAWTPDTTISGCLHDLELALADPTLGSIVSDVVIKSSRPLYDESGAPLTGLELIADIKYRTASNDPTTRR